MPLPDSYFERINETVHPRPSLANIAAYTAAALCSIVVFLLSLVGILALMILWGASS